MRTVLSISVKLALLVAVGMWSSRAVEAALVNTGDLVGTSDGPGDHPGGSFKVENVTQAPGNLDLFRTFCLERNENLSHSNIYYATLEAAAIFGGEGVADIGGAGAPGVLGSFDPLSPLTAWLYQSAVEGTLAGYSASSDADNTALQNVMWYIENESSDFTGTGTATENAYYAAAVAAAPTSIGSVQVVNLWVSAALAYTEAGKVQSILVVIPEAATIVVWSVLGLIGVVGRRQRS